MFLHLSAYVAATSDEVPVRAWVLAGFFCVFGQSKYIVKLIYTNDCRNVVLCSYSPLPGQIQSGCSATSYTYHNWCFSWAVCRIFFLEEGGGGFFASKAAFPFGYKNQMLTILLIKL